MAIQWFPGHMHKARKEMAKVLPDIDVVLEVLDARIPWSSENPMLADIGKDKPVLRVLTKSDLADPAMTAQWLDVHSQSRGHDAMAVSTTDVRSYKNILPRLKAFYPDDTSQRLKPRVAMVVGIPNVGKSTLINKLTGRVIAKTGNEPAITKRQQLISLTEEWSLRDTPGVLWPKVDNDASGYRLAATGAVRDTAMDSAEVATHLLDYLNVTYADQLRQRYGETLPVTQSVQTLEEIGHIRGCIGAGALVDFDRAGRLLLQEYRQGLLGQITLESPSMRKKELAETEERIARISAKREQRKLEKQTARNEAKARKKSKRF
ncbi:MAG: ribosome biogenesis GTPase YlqF [Granulosicoccus sp.]